MVVRFSKVLIIKNQCETCFYRNSNTGICSQRGCSTYGLKIFNCWGYHDAITMLVNDYLEEELD